MLLNWFEANDLDPSCVGAFHWAFKGLTIHNDHLSDENHKATGSTDHRIVRAEFEYGPA